MADVIVIGAGAAGLLAAFAAAKSGDSVTVLEKNEKAGKKIYITGKGRCNVTNACDFASFQKNIITGEKFMMSSLRAFGPEELCELLSENHLKTKTERGSRVYPVTDHASDVTKALLTAAEKAGAKFSYDSEVEEIRKEGGSFRLTVKKKGKTISRKADKVIICTGGLSYPSTGSTGDGYRFAESFGHKVVPPVPSLCPLLSEEAVGTLSGINLKNTEVSVRRIKDGVPSGKVLYRELGEVAFLTESISGPIPLTVSALFSRELSEGERFEMLLDLKPALSEEELDQRILRDFFDKKNIPVSEALSALLISGIREEVLKRAGIPEETPVHDITKKQRESLRRGIKGFRFIINGTAGFKEAIVTKGGVALSEINPKTMESKKVPGLYFAGEVLDIDALTGGFNLQLAFSTGAAGGRRNE